MRRTSINFRALKTIHESFVVLSEFRSAALHSFSLFANRLTYRFQFPPIQFTNASAHCACIRYLFSVQFHSPRKTMIKRR